jgi:hypothetical protein
MTPPSPEAARGFGVGETTNPDSHIIMTSPPDRICRNDDADDEKKTDEGDTSTPIAPSPAPPKSTPLVSQQASKIFGEKFRVWTKQAQGTIAEALEKTSAAITPVPDPILVAKSKPQRLSLESAQLSPAEELPRGVESDEVLLDIAPQQVPKGVSARLFHSADKSSPIAEQPQVDDSQAILSPRLDTFPVMDAQSAPSNNDEDDDASTSSSNSSTTSIVSSNVSSSVYTNDTADSTSDYQQQHIRASLQLAAQSLVGSVNFYRGRYAAGPAAPTTSSTPSTPRRSGNGSVVRLAADLPDVAAPLSSSPKRPLVATPQTARILKSKQATHLHEIISSLPSHEHMMLLGHGMLGVNLKQSFLRNEGVYVDFLVLDGAAAKSLVVMVGDSLRSVGNTCLRKETIHNVPGIIASTARPAPLIFSTGTDITSGSTFGGTVDAIDIVIGLFHCLRDMAERHNVTEETAADSESPSAEVRDDLGPVIQSRSDSFQDTADNLQIKSSGSGAMSTMPVVDPFVGIEEAHLHDASLPLFRRSEVDPEGRFLSLSFRRCNDGFDVSFLCLAAAGNASVRNALRFALLSCLADGRRLPFLARYFAMLETEPMSNRIDHIPAGLPTPNAMLGLLVELHTFADRYDVIPASRRIELAKQIAYRYFLPTPTASGIVAPMVDFHQLVPATSIRKLETSLGANVDQIPREIFATFQNAALDSLSIQPFVSFLVSNECARMRAYLRGTAPCLTAHLSSVIDGLVQDNTDPHAKSYFLFLLCYLLCRTEKEGYGENDNVLHEPGNHRVGNAAASICAVVFIRKVVLPSAQSDTAACTIGRLWDEYVAPETGALARVPTTNEANLALNRLRNKIVSLQSQIGEGPDARVVWNDESLFEMCSSLADGLLFDFAASEFPKFREHKFHEWMSTDVLSSTEGPSSTFQAIPKLPQGSIKSLLRKVDFPMSVSRHKPTREVLSHDIRRGENSSEGHVASELDYAVVFGTSVNETADNLPTAQIERYSCAGLREKHSPEADDFGLAGVPGTLESYAMVSRSRWNPLMARDSWVR